MGCLSSIAAPGKYLQYEGLLNHAWIDWPSSHSMLWLAKCMVYESTWTNFSCILMSTLISSLAPPAWHPIFPIFVVISIHVLLRCHIYISIDFLSLCFLCWFHDERGLRLLLDGGNQNGSHSATKDHVGKRGKTYFQCILNWRAHYG